MASKRKSFVLHKDSLDILTDLTDEQAGKLFKAIYMHQTSQEYELDQITKMVFLPFKNQFARDDEKYLETCKRRAEAGSKGGIAKVANASKSKQKQAKLADSKSKSKNESDSVSDSDSKRNNKVSQSLDYSSWPSLPSDQVLKDWLAMRKRLKANVTQTVINRLSKQFNLASQNGFTVDDCLSECILRNWRGFEFEWLAKNKSSMNDISNLNYSSGDL